MACTIVASSSAHHYRIVTTYLADPARDAVLMHVRFEGPRGDQLYVRLDPLAGGTGGGGSQNAGGNSASLVSSGNQTVPVDANTNTTTNAVNRNYAVPTYMALESSTGFSNASVGYAGTASDGLTMLDSTHALTPYGSAPDGHVTLTAELPAEAEGPQGANLALGFGTTQAQALSVAGASVHQSFHRALGTYQRQWSRYDAGLRRPALAARESAAIHEYYESVNVVRASVDKTFPGAIAAGLASPWGQSVPAGNLTNGEPTYFGSYREVFARDLYEAFTALLVAGDVRTARAATRFLFDRQQQADGSMPRNSLLNGEAGSGYGRAAARRDLLPDPDGLAVRPRARQDPLHPARDPRRGLPRRARALRRCRALGGAVRLLALDDRRRDRRPDGRRAHRAGQQRPRPRRRLPGDRR